MWVVSALFGFMLSENRRQNAQINGTGRFGEGLLLRLPPGDFCDLGFCWMSLASTASDALFAPATCPVSSIWTFSGRKNDKLVKKQGEWGARRRGTGVRKDGRAWERTDRHGEARDGHAEECCGRCEAGANGQVGTRKGMEQGGNGVRGRKSDLVGQERRLIRGACWRGIVRKSGEGIWTWGSAERRRHGGRNRWREGCSRKNGVGARAG